MRGVSQASRRRHAGFTQAPHRLHTGVTQVPRRLHVGCSQIGLITGHLEEGVICTYSTGGQPVEDSQSDPSLVR